MTQTIRNTRNVFVPVQMDPFGISFQERKVSFLLENAFFTTFGKQTQEEFWHLLHLAFWKAHMTEFLKPRNNHVVQLPSGFTQDVVDDLLKLYPIATESIKKIHVDYNKSKEKTHQEAEQEEHWNQCNDIMPEEY